MARMVNVNADIAEGWGAYDIGNDADLMKIIKSASVACGFHAGDRQHHAPPVHAGQRARRERRRASGLQRPLGFRPAPHPNEARRDLEYMIAYQIGALQAMAAYAGLKVTHLEGAWRAQQHGGRRTRATPIAIGRAIKVGRSATSSMSPFTARPCKRRRAKLCLAVGSGRLSRPALQDDAQPRRALHPGHRSQGSEAGGRAGAAYGA